MTREEAPGLWELARRVAEKVGTRPIDDVYVTPETEMAVFERGHRLDRWRGRTRRVIVLGLAVIT